MAIEDEPLDPRPVDRHRMDLHNCHSPSTGPPSFTGTTTTMVAARMRVSRGNTGGEHPLRARCSPWIGPHRGLRPGQLTRLARGERIRQLPIVVQVAARRPRAALCAARLVAPLPERSPTAIPWRERPPEMAAWPAKPAASDVVAHATAERVLAPRASTRQSAGSRGEFDAQPARELDGFLDALFTLVPALRIGTADAARGAATKSGGWRSSGALSCQSKPMVDEPVSASAARRKSLHADDLQAERQNNKRGVLCRARNALSAASLMERGREQPPGSAATVLSRGRPGGLLTPRCPVSQTARRNARVICAPFASALFVAYASQIAHGMRCTFDADFCLRTRLRRPSHDQRRAVLDVVKALAALDPAGFGLDDACAQLEGSTYVMADEARPHFCVDRTRRQSYREDLVGAIAHPSAVSPDAER